MKTIRENLITLRDFIASVPAKEIDLNYEVLHTSCGTIFCVLGWAAASNAFPGLHWLPGHSTIEFNGDRVDYFRAYHTLDVLFGEDSHANLFQWPGGGDLDEGLGFPARESVFHFSQEDQKALALARIDAQLRSYP